MVIKVYVFLCSMTILPSNSFQNKIQPVLKKILLLQEIYLKKKLQKIQLKHHFLLLLSNIT